MRKIFLLVFSSLLINLISIAQIDSSNNFKYISRIKNEYYNQVGNDKPGYKQFKRWEWYYSTRTGEGGKMVDNLKLNQEALLNSNANRTSGLNLTEANTGNWTAVGPSFVSTGNKGIGRANRMAFHPTNPNILYVAGATGGLWITTDGGQNWYSYSEGIPNMALSGVAVDYTNTSIIYVLTGDADDGGGGGQMAFGKPSIGVLKSYDGGFTWYRTGLEWDITDHVLAYKLIMDPTNPSILMVATDNGIIRTTDGFNSWTRITSGIVSYDIEYNPANPSIVYTSGTGTGRIRVHKSTNGGQSFAETFSLPTALNAQGDASANRSALAVSPANSNYVYLLMGPCTDSAEFHGIYRSTDMAASFQLRTTTPNILGGSSTGSDSKDQENYDLAIAVNPTNINKVASGGIRLWTSTNGGSSFTFQSDNVSSSSYYHADIHDLVYHPLNNTILYMCGDGGIYRSDDEGNNWYHLNTNLQLTQYYKISTNPLSGLGNENVMIGGTQDNGTNKRSIAGTGTFSQINGSDGMDCFIDPDNTNVYVVSTQNGRFLYSTNGGSNFEIVCDTSVLNNALNRTVIPYWVTPVAEITGGTTQFVMGYKPVVKAVRISANVYGFVSLGFSGRTFVKTARGNANRIYIGDNNDNIARTSTNGGQDWTIVFDDPLPVGNNFTDLAFDPNNGNRMWLTFGGYSNSNATRKVLYSGNGGDNGGTWNNITGSLPNVPINCIVYDGNAGAIDAVYIGTDIGVFYRDNNLGDWIPFSNGLPVVEITDLEIHPIEGVLRAGTYGRGIWETSLYSNCPANITLNTSNTAIFKPYYFQASQTVTSTAQHVGTGANVFYKAGTELTLSPGFIGSAAGTNVFEAAVGSCGGGVPGRIAGKSIKPLKGFLVN